MPPHDEIDRLSALPHDVRVEILSHLRPLDAQMKIYGTSVTSDHALGNMALVSKKVAGSGASIL